MPNPLMNNKALLVILLAGVTLAGCGVLGRRAPDETLVTDNPSLILPPNFDLRPPRDGGDAEAVLRRHDETRALITGQQAVAPATTSASVPATGSDAWLLKRDVSGTQAVPVPMPPSAPMAAANEPAVEQEQGFWQRWFGWTGL